MTRVPTLAVARGEGLLIEAIGDETVVFDPERNEAHCLAPLAAAVFSHCDGRSRVEELAQLASATLERSVAVEEVEATLAQLEERHLLEVPPRVIVPPRRFSRRGFVRRTAAATAAVSAAPLITSIVTPAHAQIISPTPGCPRAVCSSQGNGDPFCNNIGCPDPLGLPRDSCECELCCILLDEGRVPSCPYTCDGQTAVDPPDCPDGSTQGGCRPDSTTDRLDGFCIQRPGDTSEPCQT